MKKENQKLISLLLVLALTLGMFIAAPVSASAAEAQTEQVGQILGKYTPSSTSFLKMPIRFAMPGAWKNAETAKLDQTADVTLDNDYPGVYWWSGMDQPDKVARDGHGWPGYQFEKEEEEGVTNLFKMEIPGNNDDEDTDVSMVTFNNYLDGGTDKTSYAYWTAVQAADFPVQGYSKADNNEYDDAFWRYVYSVVLEKMGYGTFDPAAEDFWEQVNRKGAQLAGKDYDNPEIKVPDGSSDAVIAAAKKKAQNEFLIRYWAANLDYDGGSLYYFDFDLDDVFGEDYGVNFCISMAEGIIFTFDNMVYVVDPDPDHMTVNYEGKPCYTGEVYFYYGSGEYGTYPTPELNANMGGVSGNFTDYDYLYSQPYYTQLETIPSDPGYGYSGKIRFNSNSTNWNNYEYITCYLYDHTTDEQLITWGSKKGRMTEQNNGIWSFDLADKGITLYSNHNYGCIFTADWGIQTCDLIITEDNMGDTAYCTGNMVENSVDSNKKSCEVKWYSGTNGNPICITSIGNVIGDTFWRGETAYGVFYGFLTDPGMNGLNNAVWFNPDRTREQIVYDTGHALGLSDSEIERALAESGTYINGGSDSGGSSSGGSSSGSGSFMIFYGFKVAELDDGTVEITDYYSNEQNVVIPETFKIKRAVNNDDPVGSYDETMPQEATAPTSAVSYTYVDAPVTRIGDWAFANNKFMKTVSVPDTVTSVGNGAFYNCTSLTGIELPDSVTEIGASAFEKCLYLESASLGGVTEIPDDAFFDCRRLKNFEIPATVTKIGEEAFYNCRSLTELVIPMGVTTVGTENSCLGTFENCKSLGKIQIPASVSFIEDNAFDGCSGLKVFAKPDSYGEQFTKAMGLAYRVISTGIIGDVDGSEKLNAKDRIALTRYLAKWSSYDFIDPTVADLNGDGKVNAKDRITLTRHIAKWKGYETLPLAAS